MFFCCMATFMAPFMMTTTVFSNERPVFLREQANKMYNVVPYYVAKILADVPSFIITPLIFNAVTYYLIGYYDDATHWFQFALIYILNSLAAISIGYFISSAIKD